MRRVKQDLKSLQPEQVLSANETRFICAMNLAVLESLPA